MADDNTFKIFGFEIKRSKKKEREEEKLTSIVPPTSQEGDDIVQTVGTYNQSHTLNFDIPNFKNQTQMILKYRGVAQQSEVDMAIDEIVNESIVTNEHEKYLELNLDELEVSENIKKKMKEEFEDIYSMLNFDKLGYDLFRSWYIDGRLYHHLVVDSKNPKKGIQEIRYIDPTKIKKVKKVHYKKDPKTQVEVVDKVVEFYKYERVPGQTNTGIILSKESVSFVPSGLLDEHRRKIISHLHKGLKPVNQLRMMEDSLVIYRMARAPERRIFYIDTGNMGPQKSAAYMKDVMSKYRNKLVYDAETGLLKDDRKHMSMLEDFWLPRKEGGRGTEISTLPGGENLGQIDDILYFQKRLYRSLNVPVARLEQENQFSLGRASEISRDEIKFQKFIDRLRLTFSQLFLDILRKQLELKGIIGEGDWEEFKNDIFIDYQKDNYFTELKESEMLGERLNTLERIASFTGEYVSHEWVWKNIMKFNDDEIKEIKKQMKEEEASGDFDNAEEDGFGAAPPKPQPAPAPKPAPSVSPEEREENKDKEQTQKEGVKSISGEFLAEAELNLIEKITDYLDDDE